ncbi:SDR family NAD(P)-dependent oxidoreductase [Streptomyces sp. Ag109_O5-10]|uniref:SDR family NAD(P)-dependent oxidoreductase n=1 Tax=Streptomyces sp. Ag109_O5-10 TaxID=1855349 RepID=UPI000894934C|nr:glucose 1-dehydrogenase [Streptomyces sp. Ag109_O5-10]SEE41725.1 NAD(P)-dependent dehydrogenase, short-chain alcohol dehydrogenase family [Streptomyces sp. Ag109_O5-10]
MTARFKDKVVVVTGAGAGIGRASARAFAREGATVVAAGARPESVEETARLVAADGGTAAAVVADVTRPEDMERLVRTTVERHGGLHVAHNNAGVFGRPTPVADLDLSAWRSVLDVNLNGVLLSMQQEIRHMRAHGGGVIVNTASNIGYHGRRPGMAAYAASKAAVSTLTRVAALDHIKDNVRINAVSPGATDTGMSLRPGETEADRAARLATTVPIARVATTEEIVNAVLWLASDESSFVVGHDLVVDGGVTT